MKEHFFFFICGYFFWQFLPSNAPIILYNNHYWWFSLSQDNWWTKYLSHPKIRRSKPCLLVFVSLIALDGFHLLLSTELVANLTLKWWVHVSSIVSYLCKNSFLLHWNSCKQHSESLMYCSFWLTVCKHGVHFEHSFLIDKCSCKMVNTLLSDIFKSSAISQNFNLWSAKMSLWSFLLLDNCRIWVTWAFSIICVCTTTFKVSIPPLNHCFRWSRVWIILMKPLLCLNSIFSHQKAMLYPQTKFRFFHCFENLLQ